MHILSTGTSFLRFEVLDLNVARVFWKTGAVERRPRKGMPMPKFWSKHSEEKLEDGEFENLLGQGGGGFNFNFNFFLKNRP
jgi:hypothetical protein